MQGAKTTTNDNIAPNNEISQQEESEKKVTEGEQEETGSCLDKNPKNTHSKNSNSENNQNTEENINLENLNLETQNSVSQNQLSAASSVTSIASTLPNQPTVRSKTSTNFQDTGIFYGKILKNRFLAENSIQKVQKNSAGRKYRAHCTNNLPLISSTLKTKMSTTERHRLEYLAPDRFKTDIYDRHGFIIPDNGSLSPELTSKDLNQLRARENKWLKMLNKWDKSVKSDKSKIKRRCMKGIPYSLRGKVWTFLTGSYFATQIQQISDLPPSNNQSSSNNSKLQHQQLSANLSANSTNSGQFITPSRNFDKYLEQRIPDETRDQIERDLHRQFPEHESFRLRSNAGISELRKVLHAYTEYAKLAVPDQILGFFLHFGPFDHFFEFEPI